MAIYDKTATNKLLSGKYLNNFCLFCSNAIADFVAEIGLISILSINNSSTN